VNRGLVKTWKDEIASLAVDGRDELGEPPVSRKHMSSFGGERNLEGPFKNLMVSSRSKRGKEIQSRRKMLKKRSPNNGLRPGMFDRPMGSCPTTGSLKLTGETVAPARDKKKGRHKGDKSTRDGRKEIKSSVHIRSPEA